MAAAHGLPTSRKNKDVTLTSFATSPISFTLFHDPDEDVYI